LLSVLAGRPSRASASGASIPFLFLALLCLGGRDRSAAAQSNQANTGPVAVSGQVINSVSGQAVPRALVRLGDRAVLTNYEGRFEFDQVTDNGSIQITKPGFSMAPDPFSSMPVIVRTDRITGPLTIRLYPEAIITVAVTAPDGDPLQGVSISAQRILFDGAATRWTMAGNALTDSHGNARLPLPSGDYKLTTRYVAPNADRSEAILPLTVPVQTLTDTSAMIHLHNGDETHLDLHPPLRHTYPVSLLIEGLPIQSTPNIAAISADGSRISLIPERGSAPGTQRVTVPSGTYTLTGRTGDQDATEMAETSVTVSNSEVSGVVLNFMQVPSIPITLSVDPTATPDNSNPSPPNLNQLGLLLQNLQPDPDSGNGQVPLQTRNGYSFFTLPFGTYRLHARSGSQWHIESATYGNSDLLQENLVAAPGAGGASIRLVVSNQTGTVQGTTILSGTGTASWIYLISTTPSLAPITVMHSRDDGSFSNSRVPPGSYRGIALEQPRQLDFSDPAVAAPFTARMQSVTVEAGAQSTLNLDVVPFAELYP
jgi:hypothetical protein